MFPPCSFTVSIPCSLMPDKTMSLPMYGRMAPLSPAESLSPHEHLSYPGTGQTYYLHLGTNVHTPVILLRVFVKEVRRHQLKRRHQECPVPLTMYPGSSVERKEPVCACTLFPYFLEIRLMGYLTCVVSMSLLQQVWKDKTAMWRVMHAK